MGKSPKRLPEHCTKHKYCFVVTYELSLISSVAERFFHILSGRPLKGRKQSLHRSQSALQDEGGKFALPQLPFVAG